MNNAQQPRVSPIKKLTRAALTFVTTAIFASAAQAGLKVGDQAPDFNLTGSDGQQHKLSDLNGRYVVIAFFPKAYTRGWTIECKSLRDSDQEIRKFDVAFFMASTDSVEDNTGFAKKNGATFPILADPTKATARAYGVLAKLGYAKRWTYYIDPAGKIALIDKSVNPANAGAGLVANLQALNAPVVEDSASAKPSAPTNLTL